MKSVKAKDWKEMGIRLRRVKGKWEGAERRSRLREETRKMGVGGKGLHAYSGNRSIDTKRSDCKEIIVRGDRRGWVW